MQHGRRKLSHDEIPSEQKALDREKAARALKHMHSVLEARWTCKELTPEVNEMTMKALQINPEVATIWNFRRDLLSRLPASTRTAALKKELELINMATKLASGDAWDVLGCRPYTLDWNALTERLPLITKSYCVWHQRTWVVNELLDLVSSAQDASEGGATSDRAEGTPEELIASELGVINKLLSYDGRNFHVWNYRAFLLSHPAYKGDKTKLDRETSQRLIDQNFSNYSAWHLRSTLKDLDVHEELELVRQAYYTEPNDQSVWQYHNWLTIAAEGKHKLGDEYTPEQVNILKEELVSVEELLQVEPEAKYALLTKAKFLRALDRKGSRDEVRSIFLKLEEVDPLRKGFYQDWLEAK
ncbi:hypothetical protein FOZ61_001258 [Perkinsus olseni]|uniref:Geranylgeranyl transferase type-2 subunit alpha n=1 Tax=Perkinsus olseni TaxID=32597 RepID=A0A7J6MGG4_PEROL|nr:hypothetical protein FOZ61_001258 [Perkinsus olseni]KAF4675367.1 hypothetical protein FOL46_001999 [Perkinsus olseni]